MTININKDNRPLQLLKLGIFDNGYIILLIFLLTSIIAGIVGHIPVWGMLKFLYIIFSAIFLPGWLIQQQLKVNLKDGISSIFFSFALGSAVAILLYACLLVLNIQTVTAYIFYAISILSIGLYAYIRSRRFPIHSIQNHKTDVLKVSIILSVVFILSFVIFQMSQRSALHIGYQNLFHDSTYWFKNCIASTKGYPLPELSVNGLHLYWHLFSCFYVAIIHFCTNIGFYDICFSLSYLWDMFLLVGSVYIVLNELLENKKLVYFGCIILLFVTGFEKQLAFSYIEHIYQCKLGVSMGLTFSLFSFVFFIKAIKQSYVFSKEFVIALLFFAVATGAKVPYACVLLVAIGFLYVFSSNKQNWWKNILALGCFLSIFLVITKLFIIDNNALVAEASSHRLSLSLQGSALLIPKINVIYLSLSKYIGSVLSWIIVTVGFVIGTNYVAFGMFLLALAVAIIKKKYKDIFLCSVFLMVIVGIILGIFVHHPGRSQVYFLFTAIPYAVIFTLLIYEQCEFKLKRPSLYLFNGFIVVSVIVTILFSSKIFVGGGTYKANSHSSSFDGFDITRDEIIALQWVRNNLPQDIVLATNKVLAPEGSRSWVTSAYSERQVYFEGWKATNIPYPEMIDERLELTSAYFQGEEWAKDKMIIEGITHAVLYKAFNSPNSHLGKILFENNAMIIYELDN